MYQVSVQKAFIARHFLIGGDWGKENDPHAHAYRIVLDLSGKELDKHGYLVDILEIERILASQIERYGDAMLNDLPEFAGLNPSLEHFARILCSAIEQELQAKNITQVKVQLWENLEASASYAMER